MPSDQERSEPTPAEVAENVVWLWEKLRGSSIGSKGSPTRAKLVDLIARRVEATERAAKRDALVGVAKEVCMDCHNGAPLIRDGLFWTHDLSDDEMDDWDGCDAAAIHDALSALESSGEAK